MHDIIVIGKGPAGIQAAIYAKRSGMDVLVIGKDYGSLAKAERIENYYGLEKPLSGSQLAELGWNQAKELGIDIHSDEVVSLDWDGGVKVTTAKTSYEAVAVIIATGNTRLRPPIKGIEAFEGRGVSYCAVCDGFFYRGKSVAVIGEGSYALHEAETLKSIVGNVVILSNGKVFTKEVPEDIPVDTRPIKEVGGGEILEKIVFQDGEEMAVQGIFAALGSAGAAGFAKKLGIETAGNSIMVNADMSTAVPAIFAAGDCTGGLLQVSKAVSDGAAAGLSAVSYVKKAKQQQG